MEDIQNKLEHFANDYKDDTLKFINKKRLRNDFVYISKFELFGVMLFYHNQAICAIFVFEFIYSRADTTVVKCINFGNPSTHWLWCFREEEVIVLSILWMKLNSRRLHNTQT